MKSIEVFMVGYPRVTVDGQIVVFPFKKAEAVFYILMLEKQLERLEMCTLLWPNVGETASKKNLRNAIYTIRKTLGVDIFVLEKRSLLKIDTEKIKVMDYDQIIEQNENYCALLLSNEDTELLKGFYIGDSIEFEDWLSYKRETFKDNYKNCLLRMCQSATYPVKTRIKYLKKIIDLDEFDEKSYFLLIQLYIEEKNYQKCLEIFHHLEDLFYNELGILPSKEISGLIETMMQTRQNWDHKTQEKNFTFGREESLFLMKKEWKQYITGKESKKLIILGEAGIGKTNLVEKFESTLPSQVSIFRMQCYLLEQNYYYESLRTVMEQIGHKIKTENIEIPSRVSSIIVSLFPSFNFDAPTDIFHGDDTNYSVIEKSVITLFHILSKNQKTVLIIEDIHWIDKMSFQILKVLLCQENMNIFVIMTCRLGVEEPVSTLIHHLHSRTMLNTIELKRFTLDETKDFIHHFIDMDDKQIQYIYQQSEGNPLFITEYINNIQQNKDFDLLNSKAGDVIRSRIINIPREAIKILEICAVFLDTIQIDPLLAITGKSKVELIESLDDLVSRRLLIENYSSAGELQLTFSHNKIKEYVTAEMSKAKKLLLHKRFAEYYEHQLKNSSHDSEYYPRILYHYQEARNRTKYFEYRLKRFSGLVKTNHEMFPEIDGIGNRKITAVYLDKEEIENELDLIQQEYEVIREFENQLDFKEIELVYLFTLGRLQVDVGKHDTGKQLITKSIQLAEELEIIDYVVKGWFKLVHLGINAHDLQGMNQALESIESKLSLVRDEGIFGKLLRLKGYHSILSGHYVVGENLLKDSINVFKKSVHSQRYVLNEAAAYLYLGESDRLQQRFEDALEKYNQALVICQDRKLYSGMAYILGNKGRVYYELGKIDESKASLLESKSFYDKIIFMWGRYIPDAFLAMLYAVTKDEEKSLFHFRNAFENTRRMLNPYDKGVMCRVKAETLLLIKDFKNKNQFYELIEQDSINCCRGQYVCFDLSPLDYEKKRMIELLQNNTVKDWFCKSD
jgi:DNA-binding SARP family transcriptional activator/tetratricopeptide (TPR) repeat protein